MLSDLGELSYNGFRFGPDTKTTQVRVTPEYDSSGRAVTHNAWALAFRAHLSARTPAALDAVTGDALARLTKPGGALVYRARGLGNPDVNTGGVRDVKWGPKPGPVGLKPVAGGVAVELTWSVEVCLPACPDGAYDFALMEFAYAVEHQVDDAGYVTRHIRGHLQVPMTRVGPNARALPDSADAYRERIAPKLIRGFRRTFGPFVLSEDRRRLDFSFTDEEMPGDPLPAGVVEATVSESVSTSKIGAFEWTHQIQASYRLHRDATGVTAAKAFFALLKERIPPIMAAIKALPPVKGDLPAGGAIPLPLTFSFSTPNRHGKPAASLSISYRYFARLRDILGISRLWEPLVIPGVSWELWAASLRNTALNPYGATRLTFAAGDERITDLCDAGDQYAQLTGVAVPALPRGRPETARQTDLVVKQLLAATFPAPPPESSWMHYECDVLLETDDGTVPITTLPTKPLTADDDIFGTGDSVAGRAWDALAGAAGGTGLPADDSTPRVPPGNVLQNDGPGGTVRRVAPSAFVYLIGRAVRAGFPIDPPRLTLVNGVRAVPANRPDRGEGFARGVKASAVVPLHWCSWRLRYYLPSVPDGPIKPPANPLAGSA